MKAQDGFVALLWIAALAIILVFAFEAMSIALTAAGNIATAIITGAAGILLAIVTHYLAQTRSQETQSRIAADQRALEVRQQMQENYRKLIEKVDTVISGNADIDFYKLEFEAWVVGSPEVVKAISTLMDATDVDTKREGTKQLLAAMRTDLELEALPKEFELTSIRAKSGATVGA